MKSQLKTYQMKMAHLTNKKKNRPQYVNNNDEEDHEDENDEKPLIK